MTEVTVFVDAAVLGSLPPVCVKDGTPTYDHLTITTEIAGGSGFGIAWLLVLMGPLGWLGLIVIACMRRPADVLSVRLPFSEPAYQRYRMARRTQHILVGAAAVLAVGAYVAYRLLPLGGLTGGALGLCALVGFIAAWVEGTRARSATVGVALDASRRWVTLSRVHPAFASAVRGPMAPLEYSNWPPP